MGEGSHGNAEFLVVREILEVRVVEEKKENKNKQSWDL
jgi:hypothetical protein